MLHPIRTLAIAFFSFGLYKVPFVRIRGTTASSNHLYLCLFSSLLSLFFLVQRPHCILMDNLSNNASTSSSWDLEMSMGNHLLFDHAPLELVQPIDHFQAHVPSPSLPGGAQMAIQKQVGGGHEEDEEEGLGAMKEMMYKIAAMQPVDIDPSTIKKPKRRNVRISDDPQSIAARHRRERISERIRTLQRLVPGGTKMDTASMLDEAIRYVKFLKRQVQELQSSPPPPHMAQVLAGHPASSMDWPVRPDPRASSSSSSMGTPPGLGFGFDGPSDHRMN